MGCQRNLKTRKYLMPFDQIVDQMANEMLSIKFTNNITINFIECMIPHHQAAICMSEKLLEYTNYQSLQEMARNIIKMQEAGMEQMREIARTTTPRFLNSPQNVKCYIEKYIEITQDMISRMKNSPRYRNISLNFINEMIPHQEGAIAMSENLLQYYIDPRLKNVVDSIIQQQRKEVKELEEIRRTLYSRR